MIRATPAATGSLAAEPVRLPWLAFRICVRSGSDRLRACDGGRGRCRCNRITVPGAALALMAYVLLRYVGERERLVGNGQSRTLGRRAVAGNTQRYPSSRASVFGSVAYVIAGVFESVAKGLARKGVFVRLVPAAALDWG